MFASLLHTIRREARRVNAENVRFHLPGDHGLGIYLRRFGCVCTSSFPANSGSMGRLISTEAALHKVLRRRDALPRVTLQTETETVSLGSTGSRARSVRMPQMQLAQLVFGYRPMADIAISEDLTVSPSAVALLSDLFPFGNPYTYWGDRF